MMQSKNQEYSMEEEQTQFHPELPDEIDLDELAVKIDESNIDATTKSILLAEIVKREEFSGPIPHPDILAKYEENFPGMGYEIFSMAKKQQDHSHAMEKSASDREDIITRDSSKGVDAYIKITERNQIFMHVTVILFIMFGFFCVWRDQTLFGAAAFIVSIGTYCLNIFFGKSTNDSSDESDDEKSDDNKKEQD